MKISDWEKHGIHAGISTRNGGVSIGPYDTLNLGLHVNDEPSQVKMNREILARDISYPLIKWVCAEQVHGTVVKRVTNKDAGKGSIKLDDALRNCDALITNETNLLLTAFFADCVPLFFIDPNSTWIGIAHAGWKGTVAGIGPKVVLALKEASVNVKDIRVAIGPCISKTQYEVDQKVIDHIPLEYRSEKILTEISARQYQLDLKELNQEMLINAGISPEHIELTTYCTYDNKDDFYSHRRDKGETGRMLAFIGSMADSK